MAAPPRPRLVTTLAAALLYLAAGDPVSPGDIRWSPAEKPTGPERLRVLAWRSDYRRQMDPVRRQAEVLLQTIHEGRLDRLPALCSAWAARLDGLEREALLGVEEPLLRLHLARGLQRLEESRQRCRRGRVFDLAYRLQRARIALREVDRRLKRYR